MANAFDQFDTNATPAAVSGGNPFDQFDASKPKVDMFDTVSDNFNQGATFGLGNRAAAGLAALVASGINGQPIADNYETARNIGSQRLHTEMQQHPVAAIGSNIIGALGTGGLSADTAAGSAITNSLRTGSLPARVAKGALAGSASGAAYGAGTADYDKSLQGAEQGAISGALVGGVIPAAGAALSDVGNTALTAVKGAFAKSPEAVQDIASSLKSGAGNLYNQMRQVGAIFNPAATKDLVSDIGSAVASNHFIPELNPKTLAIVNHIEDAAQNGTLGLDDLDQYRRLLGRVGATEDGASAGKVRQAIDNFVNSASGKDLVAGAKYTPQDLTAAQSELQKLQGLHDNLIGSIQNNSQMAGKQGGFWRGRSVTEAAADAKNLANVKQQISSQSNFINHIQDNIANAPLAEQKAQQAIGLLNQGRQQYTQASKFEDISDILTKADGDPNKIKSGLTRFLNNADNTKGWSDSEIKALKDAASSTGTEKLLKMGGKFGLDLGTALTPGNTIGPIVGGAVGGFGTPIAGTAARIGQKLSARGSAQNLLDTLQNGGSGAVSQPMSGLLSAPAGALASGLRNDSTPMLSNPQTAAQGIKNAASPQMPQQVAPPVQVSPQSNNQPQNNSPLFQRVIQTESAGNQSAISPKGAIGVSQIMPGTAKEAAEAAGLPYDPIKLRSDQQYNAALGQAYLGKLQAKYKNDALALAAYNWGQGNVDLWLKSGADPAKLPKETQDYLTKILG